MIFQSSLATQSSTATANGAGYILKRSLDLLERSQRNLEGSLVNLERSLVIENTLSRIVNSQEELRRMVMALRPVATPTPIQAPQTLKDILDAGLLAGYKETNQNHRSRHELPAASNDAVTKGNYFSLSNLVSFAEPMRRVKIKPTCKKCGKGLSPLRQRRDHVGIHINAKFLCPFSECGYSARVLTMFRHLRTVHKTNLHCLTNEERGRFEDARKKFYEKVDAVMVEYFS